MDREKLQRPSPAPSLLDQMMRQVCLELETVSDVRSARLGSESSRLKPGSSPPAGSGTRLAEVMRKRYEKQRNNWDRLLTIRAAQRMLEGIRGKETKRRLSQVRGTKQWKRAIANDTRASAVVANERGISASYVRKLRGRHQGC